MAEKVKSPATKPEDLSSILRTHMMTKVNIFLTSTNMYEQ